METSEFRIGNLVLKSGEICTINSIGNVWPYPLGIKEYDNNLWSLEYFSPIPLTEEILLKCGFEKKQYSCRNEYYYFINDIVLVKGQKTIVESDYDGNITFALPEFVHQLQNLIFIIIGEELKITI